jgi:hypothetical protein
MATGNKTTLKTALVNLSKALQGYDGSEGKTPDDAIDKYAGDFADALDTYMKSVNIQITPAQLLTGALVAATGGPVTCSNNIPAKAIDSV